MHDTIGTLHDITSTLADNTDTYTHTRRHTYTERHTNTHRHTHTETDTQTHAHRYTQRQRQRHAGIHTQTHTDTLSIISYSFFRISKLNYLTFVFFLDYHLAHLVNSSSPIKHTTHTQTHKDTIITAKTEL